MSKHVFLSFVEEDLSLNEQRGQVGIEKRVALGNKMIGVRLSTAGPTPPLLTAAGATVVGWDIAKIVAELG